MRISNYLKVKIVANHGNYLGLPFIYGLNKREAFKKFIEKCQTVSANWSNKTLSAGGKEILIKSVLQALPTYTMTCFKFPDTVLKKYQTTLLNYWWGAKDGAMKTHWIRKEFLYKDKIAGGLGFKNMELFNKALLAKQCWRLLQQPNSLVSRILKSKYYPLCDMLSAPEKTNASYTWRSLYSVLSIVRQGTIFDASTNSYLCNMTQNGDLTVRASYNYMKQISLSEQHLSGSSSTQLTEKFWKTLWRLPLPRKVKIFTWKIYYDGIPVGSELFKRLGANDVRCKVCNFTIESAIHIFKDCWWLRALWGSVGLPSSHLNYQFSSIADWIFFLAASLNQDDFCLSITTLYFTWYNRNLIWHGKDGILVHDASTKIKLFIQRFRKAQSVYNIKERSATFSWQAPMEDFLKINIDAAWNPTDSIAGIGVIARDHNCTVTAIRASSIRNITNCIEAEGLALKEAILLAKDIHYDKVLFETDNSNVAEIIWFGVLPKIVFQNSWSIFCSAEFASHPDWHLNLIWREANEDADRIAKLAKEKGFQWSSLDACPMLH